jgi:outer membrane protein TolC
MKRFLLLLLAVVARVAAAETQTLDFSSAVTRALAANPALAEAAATEAEAGARARSAGELPDPTLSLGARNLPVDSLALDQDGMTMLTVGVAQGFPPVGQRALKRTAAQHATAAQAALHRAEAARVIETTRRAWLELFYLDRAIGNNTRSQALARDLEAAARARYAAGEAQQVEALLARQRVDRLAGEAELLAAQRTRQQAELARLLNEPGAVWRLPEQLPEFPALRAPAELQEALAAHPSVQAVQARIAAAGAEAAATRRDHQPAFAVEAEYGYRQADEPNGDRLPDMVSAQITLSLPLFPGARQDARDAERAAQLAAAQAARDAALAELRAELDAHLAELHSAEARLALIEDAELPRLEQALAATRAAYASGRAPLSDVYERLMEGQEIELRHWRIAVDRLLARSVIEHHTATAEAAAP